MKERPIPFSGPMVRAILDGRKTQTRRVVKPQPVSHEQAEPGDVVFYGGVLHRVSESRGRNKRAMGLLNATDIPCPFGVPGDRLWVRETWRMTLGGEYAYKADDEWTHTTSPWKPSIHMPRRASRITLEVVSVRVERLADISNTDAKAEGYASADEFLGAPWAVSVGPNPWVWVVEFRRTEPKP